MSWLSRFLASGTGRKFLVALTGLGLVFFLIIHLLGNLQIMDDSSAFNEYAHALHNSFLGPLADIGMLVLFPVHIGLVIWLSIQNRKARGGVGYRKQSTKQKRGIIGVLSSRTMVISGVVLLAFVILHVVQFRLNHDAISHDLRAAVIETISHPLMALFYIVGSLLTGWHIFHGFQAAFRSLGFNHGRYTPLIEKGGKAIGLLIGLGFASIPAWILLAI